MKQNNDQSKKMKPYDPKTEKSAMTKVKQEGSKKQPCKSAEKEKNIMPADVLEQISTSYGAGGHCRNFSLLFYRFVPDGGKEKDEKNNSWRKIRDFGNGLFQNDDVKYFIQRRDLFFASLRNIYGEKGVFHRMGITKSRLSIGFGDTGPMNTGLTIHRLYGLPYLPATAVKGVCRSWALDAIAQANGVPYLPASDIETSQKTPLNRLEAWLLTDPQQKTKKKEKWRILQESIKKYDSIRAAPEESEEGSREDVAAVTNGESTAPKYGETDHFRRIFGSQEGKGEVFFFDAFPEKTSRKLFDLDILNPHYQPYYETNGEKPPADYHSPVPIVFLTVAPCVPFCFLAASRDPALIETLEKWLAAALSESGIGAKTSLGYGELELKMN